jgi:hypothetical protein
MKQAPPILPYSSVRSDVQISYQQLHASGDHYRTDLQIPFSKSLNHLTLGMFSTEDCIGHE